MRGLTLESQAAKLVLARAADALRQTGGPAFTAGAAPVPHWQLLTVVAVAAVGVVCLSAIVISHVLRTRDPAGAEPRRSRAATALEAKACRELAAHLERQASAKQSSDAAAVCPPLALGAVAAARGVSQRGHGAAAAASKPAVVADAREPAPLEAEASGSNTSRFGTARGADEAAERLAVARAERKRSVMGAPQGDDDVVRKASHDLLAEELSRETPRIRATVYPTH